MWASESVFYPDPIFCVKFLGQGKSVKHALRRPHKYFCNNFLTDRAVPKRLKLTSSGGAGASLPTSHFKKSPSAHFIEEKTD